VFTAREQEQLDAVVALARDTLGADLLGLYLFGSAVQGGLKPDSDLDVLAVSARRLTLDEKRRLALALMDLSRHAHSPPGSRRLELTVVVGADVRPWPIDRAPRFDFQYGNWLRADFAAGNWEPWPPENPDVATLATMTLLHSRPLLGPPPASCSTPCPGPSSSA
jgi:streptomycin 3"-adenylyltransferase